MVLTETGLAKVFQRVKSFVIAQLNSKASVLHTHTSSDITDLPNGYVVDSALSSSSENPVQNKVVKNALDGYVPRSGGMMTGDYIGRNINNGFLSLAGGINLRENASVWLYGKENPDFRGQFWFGALSSDDYASARWLTGTPNGSLTWGGQPIQYGSDQRLKQQITEIDDKLLDAWESVELVQFKYNDAVDEKKDKARLHTGYVVQQIDNACKKHGVDISEYGLYCHEEYPEETEEVEVEQADGTKTKETKVIREASEHYSLRYTEVYAVECAYLRKRIKELEERLEKLEGK